MEVELRLFLAETEVNEFGDELAVVSPNNSSLYSATNDALDALQLPREAREQIAAELRLVVRPPNEDTSKWPRIGLGALLPDEKNSVAILW